MSSIDQKTFLLGVGAQKAGTSWLFRYLHDRSDCFMSPIKELHYFDVKHRPDLCGVFEDKITRELVDLIRSGDSPDYEKNPYFRAVVDRVGMSWDESGYRRYFEERVPDEAGFFGEITPSYSLLNPEGFEDIRSQFGRIRVIFLLRDPIDRHYSLMRMKERKGKVESAHDSFVEMLSDRGPFERGLYHRTVRSLERVFRPEELHFAFYENLFQDRALRKICEFAGMPFQPGQYQERVHSSDGIGIDPLTPEQVSIARDRFAEVYEFCGERFGDEIPASWHL